VYFLERGKLAVGWHTIGERRYYFRENGTVATGLVSTPEGTFLILEDGSLYAGWLEQDGYRQYFFENGVMAVGRQEVDGKTYHFSPRGIEITLVNPWNPVPEDYTMERVKLDKFYVAQECYEPLLQMLADCRAQGYNPQICSAYRTQADQAWLFDNKVQRVMKEGYEEEEAKVIAAREVAVPGTSEHQLGLAVDIVDKDHPLLDESQADRPTQIWLMEHCWEYGFILRYPVGTTDQTGIIYEPWHYRYVGREIAMELKELGITLEEYLGVA
jgi:LAS superfamily LD-carboxypeptidase LdcB